MKSKKADISEEYGLLPQSEPAKNDTYWIIMYEYGEVIPCKIKRDRVEVSRAGVSSEVKAINHLKKIVAVWRGSKLRMDLPACEIYDKREDAEARLESYVRMRQQEITTKLENKEVFLDQLCMYFTMHATSQQTAYSRSLKDLARRFFDTDVMPNLDDSDSSRTPILRA